MAATNQRIEDTNRRIDDTNRNGWTRVAEGLDRLTGLDGQAGCYTHGLGLASGGLHQRRSVAVQLTGFHQTGLRRMMRRGAGLNAEDAEGFDAEDAAFFDH